MLFLVMGIVSLLVIFALYAFFVSTIADIKKSKKRKNRTWLLLDKCYIKLYKQGGTNGKM